MLQIIAFLRPVYVAATVHLHGAEKAILPHLYEFILRTLVISRALYGILCLRHREFMSNDEWFSNELNFKKLKLNLKCMK